MAANEALQQTITEGVAKEQEVRATLQQASESCTEGRAAIARVLGMTSVSLASADTVSMGSNLELAKTKANDVVSQAGGAAGQADEARGIFSRAFQGGSAHPAVENILEMTSTQSAEIRQSAHALSVVPDMIDRLTVASTTDETLGSILGLFDATCDDLDQDLEIPGLIEESAQEYLAHLRSQLG